MGGWEQDPISERSPSTTHSCCFGLNKQTLSPCRPVGGVKVHGGKSRKQTSSLQGSLGRCRSCTDAFDGIAELSCGCSCRCKSSLRWTAAGGPEVAPDVSDQASQQLALLHVLFGHGWFLITTRIWPGPGPVWPPLPAAAAACRGTRPCLCRCAARPAGPTDRTAGQTANQQNE